MFGKSKDEKVPAPSATAPIQVTAIPAEFYGGKNPIVKFKIVEKEVNLSRMEVGEKKSPLSNTSTVTKVAPPAGALTNRHSVLIWSGVLFVVFLIGATGYYWWQATHLAALPAPHVAIVTPPPVVPIVVVPSIPEVTTTPVVTPTSTATSSAVLLNGGNLEFPSVLLGNSSDQDHDGLTDMEETVFNTNVSLPDTDSDQYSDATEVFNLYSPAVAAPARLIDTDVIQDYENPTFGYRVYYPTNWVIGNVDTAYRDVLFSSVTGESAEIRVFDKTPNQTFDDWFAVWAPSEHTSSLRDFSSVFKLVGRSRSDNLVYYFGDEIHEYVLLYHPLPNSNVVNFREIISMMARSFRLATTPLTVPEQPIVVPTSSVSSSGTNL